MKRTVKLRAVGDVALGDHPLCTGFGTHSYCQSRSAEYAFEHVSTLFHHADILFGNLECTLSEAGLRRDNLHSVQMRGQPAYLSGLHSAGFNVLNVANNHSMQHGREPFRDTVAMLQGASIAVCGLAGENHRTAVPAVVEKNGLSIAFLGYSLRPRQYFAEEPLYAEGYGENILTDVRAARKTYDGVVVSLHWGDEFIQRPSPEEQLLAHDIVDAGADLIIGHHPHVLRGIEHYGRGFIVYSLGNFVCDMLWDETLRSTAVIECHFTQDGVVDLDLVPVRISDDYQPIPLTGAAGTDLRTTIDALSRALVGNVQTSEAMERYQQDADAAHRAARRKSHLYFLRKAYKFPPRILFQQVVGFVKNRLAELGTDRPSQASSGC